MSTEAVRFAEIWLRHTSATSDKTDPTIKLAYENPSVCWEVIKELIKRDLTPEQYASLAAGLLETLLSVHGELYISAIEELAKEDPKFNYLLGGVWQCLMPDSIWDRVVSVRKKTW